MIRRIAQLTGDKEQNKVVCGIAKCEKYAKCENKPTYAKCENYAKCEKSTLNVKNAGPLLFQSKLEYYFSELKMLPVSTGHLA